jgi:prevent-host-death family protein
MEQETLAAVKANLSRFVDAAEHRHARTIITRNGRPAAALVSVADLESLEETVAVLSDAAAMRDLAEADEAYRRGEYTTLDEARAIVVERARVERD